MGWCLYGIMQIKKIEIIGILAGILELTQMFMMGDKNIIGFIFGFIACLLWTAYALKTGRATGLLFVAVPGLFLNIRGFILWGYL